VRLTAEGMQAEFCKVLEYNPTRGAFWSVPRGLGAGIVGVASIGIPCVACRFALRTASRSSPITLRTRSDSEPRALVKYGIHRAMKCHPQGEGRRSVLEVDSRSKHEFNPHDLSFLQGAANVWEWH